MSTSAPGRTRPFARYIAGATSLAIAACATWLATRYPIFPPLVLALWLLWVAACFRFATLWIGVVPALMPAVGLASWTGWLVFEELDLLLAGAAAAGYARIALGSPAGVWTGATDTQNGSHRVPLVSVLLLATLLGTGAIALVRGVQDAGSLDASLTQGYFDALNSVRLFKPFAWALLLAPLLIRAERDAPHLWMGSLAWGVTAGLAIAALGALWERAAFTDILDFSSDYRTTSLFWEMHVGGAALDGYLALSLPFALWLAWDARGRWAHAIAVAVVLLASYAALTTFSRGVFIALPAGVLFWASLRYRQRPDAGVGVGLRSALGAAAFAAASCLVAWAIFVHGGYRGLVAMLMAFAVIVIVLPSIRSLPASILALAWLTGLLVAFVIWALGLAIPKGPYILHAVLFGVCVTAAVVSVQAHERGRAFALSTMASALTFSAINVSLHWGGMTNAALPVVSGVAVALAAACASRTPIAVALASRREQLRAVAAVAMLAAVVSVFSGGAYMGDRFATSREDLDGRMRHWSASLAVLSTPLDWVFGKGLGRYPASYFYRVPDRGLPGSYSWKGDSGNGYLSLSGPRYSMSWGDLFRMSQRVSAVRGAYSLMFRLHSEADVELHAEICEKHLLYNANCAVANRMVRVPHPGWHEVTIELDGKTLSGGHWYAPRLAFFSIAVGSSGRNVGIDDVRLVNPRGTDVIANGDFTRGTERWFFTSDHHHLPWHIKSVFLNVLFEQGVVGLMAFVSLLGAFFWRVIWGSARRHPLSPVIAASVAGFLVVGMFDSLLDVPRVAWQFYVLLCLGLLVAPLGTAAGPTVEDRS